MIRFIIDFAVVAVLVIGITALNGVITNSIGEKIFGRKRKSQFVDITKRMQTGWKQVGGK